MAHRPNVTTETGPMMTSDAEVTERNRFERMLASIDRWQRRHRPTAFIYGVVKKFGDDRGSSLAALISYYGFFSLFPLLMVLFTVLGYVTGDNPELQRRIQESALSRSAAELCRHRRGPRQRDRAGCRCRRSPLGRARRHPGRAGRHEPGLRLPRHEEPNFVFKRLRSLATLGVIGVGVLASTAVGVVGSALERIGIFGQIGLAIGTVVVNAAVIAGLFRMLTVTPPGRRGMIRGALVGGVGWTLLQLIGGWYVSRLVDQASRTYGVFAVVIGLLSWIFLQARIFLYAAEAASVVELDLWPRGLVDGDPTPADERALARVSARV